MARLCHWFATIVRVAISGGPSLSVHPGVEQTAQPWQEDVDRRGNGDCGDYKHREDTRHLKRQQGH